MKAVVQSLPVELIALPMDMRDSKYFVPFHANIGENLSYFKTLTPFAYHQVTMVLREWLAENGMTYDRITTDHAIFDNEEDAMLTYLKFA